jgi:hypothetical protein
MSDDEKHFLAGDRIKISESYHWAKGVSGTIEEPAAELKQWMEGWTGCSKEEPSLHGLLTFYWVVFDTPQSDADGGGPYSEAAIDSEFLSYLL